MKFLDGGFGTYYIERTGDYGPCELANLNNRKLVLSIHKEYIASGADAILTNTFRANPVAFEDGGCNGVLKRIITEGFKIAREASEESLNSEVEVFADIGGVSDEETAQEQYLRVVDIFLELGAENFIFETLPGMAGIEAAAAKIKSGAANSTVAVSFAVSQAGYAGKGAYYRKLVEQAENCPHIDIVGLNCVCGPTHLLNLARGLSWVKKPLLIMPNAGYPAHVNGRLVFQDNTSYYAQKMLEISRLGVSWLGGCCGTKPEHISKTIAAIKGGEVPRAEGYKRYSGAEPRKLKRKPVMVELDPPVDGDDGFILSAARQLADCGVSTITLSDSPLSRSRADSVLTAALLKSRTGVDVMPHITCRDKNLIALRGSLLGARLFGIDKALIVTGDPLINAEKAFAVFNFNSKQLISYINTMNLELLAEQPIHIGGALNVNAANFDAELNKARKKLARGAEFLLTQPIFSDEAVKNLELARQELECKLYAGIMPLAGYKNAVFLSNEVPGIRIPGDVVEMFRDAENAEAVSIGYSAGIVNSVYDFADGFYFMTPMRRVELVCGLIKRCFDAE